MTTGDTDERPPDGGEPRRRSTDTASGPRIGHYSIIETLGEGGMGRVYLAYDPKLHRRVAIKLLRPDRPDEPSHSSARLLREAQALAQVSHPNLVHVYEVGEQAGQVFVVMEYIRGRTLTRWLAEARRPWREIVGVLAGAGRALAAAHRARIVHRDFKPANVIIDRDGVARVVDFGIAVFGGPADPVEGVDGAGVIDRSGVIERSAIIERAGLERSGVIERSTAISETKVRARDAALSMHVTDGGSVMGTPPYMAPEQHAGHRADARSDQFSFAVTLFEALYQVRPFPDGYEEMLAAKRAGEVRFPGENAVPGRVRAALKRALLPDPAARYPSMAELLTALEVPRRALWLAGGGVLAVAVLGIAALPRGRAGAVDCGEPPAAATVAWSDARRQAVVTAFGAVGHSFADASLRTVQDTLDRYHEDWIAMWRSSCTATHIEATQSQALFDLRMSCLERRLDGMNAVIDVLAAADTRVVERAVLTVANLTPVAVCSDEERLRDELQLPDDPRTRARVDELRRALAQVGAQVESGRYDAARTRAAELAAQAEELGYQPLVAEAQLALGDAIDDDPKRAEAAYRAAIHAATVGRHDLIAARAWNALVQNVGVRQARLDEATSLATGAEAAVARADVDGGMTATLAACLGSIASARGDYDGAIEQYRRAQRLVIIAYGEDDPRLRTFVNNLGVVLLQQGKWDDALQQFERALTLGERTLGAEHPYLADYVMNIGNVHLERHDGRSARPALERALAILGRDPESNRRRIAIVHANLAQALLLDDRIAEAATAAAAAEPELVAVVGPGHPHVFGVADIKGLVALRQRDWAVATAEFARAREGVDAALGSRHPLAAVVRMHEGELWLSRADLDQAATRLEQAEAVLRDDPGPTHPDHAAAIALLAEVRYERGQGGQQPVLEAALAVMRPLDHHARGRASFALARMQWASSPSAALVHARAASAELPPDDPLLLEVRRWIDGHA
ncbi:MAG: serine/threonine protein kinase [Deltaproteobacteria bacterium]|nr:serine/threonine protein kinase [Deltaproteobacteria bacterium]MBK8718380.1 serine/threonine protein kinase [Deltaproteobacteria bacterium]